MTRSFDLKASLEKNERHPATTDDLALWGAEIWAMPEHKLRTLTAGFEGVRDDPEQNAEVRVAAGRLIDMLAFALSGEIPPAATVRLAGEALAQVPREDE